MTVLSAIFFSTIPILHLGEIWLSFQILKTHKWLKVQNKTSSKKTTCEFLWKSVTSAVSLSSFVFAFFLTLHLANNHFLILPFKVLPRHKFYLKILNIFYVPHFFLIFLHPKHLLPGHLKRCTGGILKKNLESTCRLPSGLNTLLKEQQHLWNFAKGNKSQLDKTRENYQFLSNQPKKKARMGTGMAGKANDQTNLKHFLQRHACDLSHKALTAAHE